MLISRLRVDLVEAVLAKPRVADRDVLPAHARFQEFWNRRPEMAHFEPALQRNQRAQREVAQWMFVGHVREMRRAIDFAGPHLPPIDRRMAAEISKVASAQAPQQIEIDDHARLLTGGLNFQMIFLLRQALQPLTPGPALHPLQHPRPHALGFNLTARAASNKGLPRLGSCATWMSRQLHIHLSLRTSQSKISTTTD